MKTLNPNTKQAKAFINAYWKSEITRICKCYKTYSSYKKYAEIHCLEKMVNENGHGFRIISFNTFGFSCGWLQPSEKGNNLRIETPQNSYIIPATSFQILY